MPISSQVGSRRECTFGAGSSTGGQCEGWVHVGDADEEDARRLLELRYRLSSLVAEEYAAAGFTTVVQDNIYGVDVERWLERIRSGPKHLVVLRPSVEVVEARDAHRQRTTGKIA